MPTPDPIAEMRRLYGLAYSQPTTADGHVAKSAAIRELYVALETALPALLDCAEALQHIRRDIAMGMVQTADTTAMIALSRLEGLRP